MFVLAVLIDRELFVPPICVPNAPELERDESIARDDVATPFTLPPVPVYRT